MSSTSSLSGNWLSVLHDVGNFKETNHISITCRCGPLLRMAYTSPFSVFSCVGVDTVVEQRREWCDVRKRASERLLQPVT